MTTGCCLSSSSWKGAQAGLNWETILKKRERYRAVFADFDPVRVARFTPSRIEKLLADPGIVRNRLKVEAAVANAKAFLEVQREFGSFDAYLWRFAGGRPLDGKRRSLRDVPARTPESDLLSRDLQRRGFRFVGSTICYAFMQAVGLVNDHVAGCFRYRLAGELSDITKPLRASPSGRSSGPRRRSHTAPEPGGA